MYRPTNLTYFCRTCRKDIPLAVNQMISLFQQQGLFVQFLQLAYSVITVLKKHTIMNVTPICNKMTNLFNFFLLIGLTLAKAYLSLGEEHICESKLS